MSYVVGKNPCKRCQSRGNDKQGNNFHFYGEGLGGHCFSCSYTLASDEHKEAMGWDKQDEQNEEDEEVATKELITAEEVEKIKGYTGTSGKDSRNIPDETYKAYAVRFKYCEETGDVVETYYPYTEGYKAAGMKIRSIPKNFRSVGKIGKDSELFGQWKWKTGGGKYVVIASGEADCLAAYTMLENYRKGRGSDFDPIPCVSSAVGEAGAWKQVQAQYAWLNTYERVVVIPDQDEAGLKALKKLSEVIPKGKMFVCNLPSKDVNKMLDEGKEKSFIRCFYQAVAHSPDGILGSDGLLGKIREQALVPKIPLPGFMHKVQDLMAGGIPLGVIVNLASASGTGKSTIIDELVYDMVFNSPHRLGVITMESDAGSYGTKMLSRHMGKKIDLIEKIDDKLAFLDDEATIKASDELFKKPDGTPRWHLIEDRDGGLESLKELIMQLVVQCDCKVIICDPVQDMLEGLSNEEQAKFCGWMKGMTKTYQISYLLVNHVRKSSGGQKANSTGADMHEEDIFGSSSLIKSAACNLLFTRDKESTDEIIKNTTFMKMTKCRWSGKTGMAGEYYYDGQLHRMFDKEDWLESNGGGF